MDGLINMNMPYEIIPVEGGFKVQNTRSKKFYSKNPQTKEMAEKQMHQMQMHVNEEVTPFEEKQKVISNLFKHWDGKTVSYELTSAAESVCCTAEAITSIFDKWDGMNGNYVYQYGQKNANCPPDVLFRITTDAIFGNGSSGGHICMCALRNDNCPPDAISQLFERTEWTEWANWDSADRGDPPQLFVVAQQSKNCPPEVIEQIFETWDGKSGQYLYYIAARSKNCSASTIAAALQKWNGIQPKNLHQVYAELLRNQNCPVKMRIEYRMKTKGKTGFKSKTKPSKLIVKQKEVKQKSPTFSDWIGK